MLESLFLIYSFQSLLYNFYCIVSFKVQGSTLSLSKVLKSNYQVAGGIKLFDAGLTYHLKTASKLIEEVETIPEALDRALSYLLVELK